jgi:hypothetical protein
MPIDIKLLKPGNVLVTRSEDGGWGSKLIRLGAALRDRPNLHNHVAIFHHTDANGTPWVMEGRPAGFGWEDARRYVGNDYTMTNTGQPLTDPQRAAICAAIEGMEGTGYDWTAIAADAAHDLGFTWQPTWPTANGLVVCGQAVCSAAACYAYDKAGVPRPPGNPRTDQPEDWTTWITTRGWTHAPAP